MTPQEFAKKIAAELREHPSAWTQYAAARTIEGRRTGSRTVDANCWCLTGFIGREVLFPRFSLTGIGDPTGDRIVEALILHMEPIGRVRDIRAIEVILWNDAESRTVEEVIALLDKVAES